MQSVRTLSLLLLAGVVAVGCSPPQAYYVRPASLTQAVEGIEAVRCTNGNGSIKVRGEAGIEEMQVEASISAEGQSLAVVTAAVKGAKLQCNVVDNRAVIEVVWPEDAEDVEEIRKKVNFELVVPKACDLTLRGSNGNITADGLTGKLKAQTSNGDLSIDGESDEVELRSANGKVSAVLGGTGTLAGAVIAGNGSIDVQLGDGRSVTILAETSNGTASPAKRQLTITKKTDRTFEALQGAGAAILRLETSNGNIQVR